MNQINNYKDVTTLYRMKNKNVLVKLMETETRLKNGIAIQETRGKRDIVYGCIVLAEPGLKLPEKGMCWFPLFAGLPITLDGEQYLIVQFEDIIMVERVEDE